MKDKIKWLFLAAVVVILAAIFYVSGKGRDYTVGGGSVLTSSSTAAEKGGVTANGADFTVEPVVDGNIAQPAPDLNRGVNYDPTFSKEAVAILSSKIAENISNLKNNPRDYSGWFDLGVKMKAAGDYDWARDAWEYAASLQPSDPVLMNNLANLYGYYLKDYAQAKIYYQKTIDLEPRTANWYVRAAAFYSEVLGDTATAKKLIENGLNVLPGDSTLKSVYESY